VVEPDQSEAVRVSDRPYSQKYLRDVAESLGRPSLPPEEEVALQNAALAYFAGILDEEPIDGAWHPNDVRPALRKIVDLAGQLKSEFKKLNGTRARALHTYVRGKDLTDLQEAAQGLLGDLGKRGPMPRRARYIFVNHLADIYERLTGEEAGLSKDPDPCGPFYDFVKAALGPLKLPREDPIDGIATVISEVAKKRRDRQAPSA
jgi:hypothetical protein